MRQHPMDKIVVLTGCFAILFAWGAINLKSDSITPAEYNSIFNIFENHIADTANLAQTLRYVELKDETHPPAYFVILNLWSRLVGEDLFGLRLLSLYFGLLAVAFTYRLAKLTGGERRAQYAAILLTFSAYFAFYVHEVRMYSLLALMTAFVAWAYARAIKGSGAPARIGLVCLSLGSALIIYVHMFGFIVVAAISLYHVLFVAKNKRWFLVPAALAIAGLLYLPWLPVTLRLLDMRTDFAKDSLTWHETLLALTSIYNNGIGLLAPICAGILIVYRKRLGAGQVLVIALIALFVICTLAVNAVAPIVVARRIRYTIVFAPLWVAVLAIALDLALARRSLRALALTVWGISFAFYTTSDGFQLYTNSKDQNRDQIPPYHRLLYTPAIRTSVSDFVLSFHPYTGIGRKTEDYYGRQLRRWRGLIHIWTDDSGQPALQSTDTRYATVDSMARWNFPIWLIYNPQETDLQAMPAFTVSFLAHFHSCGRYLETDNTVIELYLKRGIPCQLRTASHPLALSYDNGAELANVVVQEQPGELHISFWWTNTIVNEYAFSIQVFDAKNKKVAQLDDVIGGDAVLGYRLDIAELTAGEYTVKLILYDFETGKGQSGTIVANQQPFERSVDLAQIAINA